MNDKIELAKKSLNLSNEEWEGIGEVARTAILKLTDPINLEDPKKEGKLSPQAEGIKKILDMPAEEYNSLPSYQTDRILKIVNDL